MSCNLLAPILVVDPQTLHHLMMMQFTQSLPIYLHFPRFSPCTHYFVVGFILRDWHIWMNLITQYTNLFVNLFLQFCFLGLALRNFLINLVSLLLFLLTLVLSLTSLHFLLHNVRNLSLLFIKIVQCISPYDNL